MIIEDTSTNLETSDNVIINSLKMKLALSRRREKNACVQILDYLDIFTLL
jgi:hypothetical protein